MPMMMEPVFLTGEAALVKYQHMKDELDAGRAHSARCLNGEQVMYFPADKAYGPGHIYSEAGVREFRISGCCEACFDDMFAPDEKED
jgi:hypothetical protein